MSKLTTALALVLGLSTAAPSFGGSANDDYDTENNPSAGGTSVINRGPEMPCSISFLGITQSKPMGWNDISTLPYEPKAVLYFRKDPKLGIPEGVMAAGPKDLDLILVFAGSSGSEKSVNSCWERTAVQAYNELSDALKENGFVPAAP